MGLDRTALIYDNAIFWHIKHQLDSFDLPRFAYRNCTRYPANAHLTGRFGIIFLGYSAAHQFAICASNKVSKDSMLHARWGLSVNEK